MISLNSNCSEVDCDEGTHENDWLEADLAATSSSCVLAFWHHPLFHSGAVHGDPCPRAFESSGTTYTAPASMSC